MCPDPQLLSVYMDGELPSPWKEKMESHLTECPSCREKLENFKQLFDKQPASAAAEAAAEAEMIKAARLRVWQNLQPRQSFQPRSDIRRTNNDYSARIWKRRLSIPIPAAAAAVVIIMLMAAIWLRGGTGSEAFRGQSNNGLAKQAESAEKANFFLAAEDEMPGIIPTGGDLNSVIQYLSSEGTDIIILRLPESTNFSRTGEPAIIRAADYKGNEIQGNGIPGNAVPRRQP